MPISAAAFITKKIAESGKAHTQIVKEAGFKNASFISMIKSGACKVPIARIPALAKSLDCDPYQLFRIITEESSPETLEALDAIYGQGKYNVGEIALVNRLRITTKGKSFKMTQALDESIDQIAKEAITRKSSTT